MCAVREIEVRDEVLAARSRESAHSASAAAKDLDINAVLFWGKVVGEVLHMPKSGLAKMWMT